MVKNLPARQEMRVWSLGREDPLEEEMTTHSSILAWRIPWTEKPGGLQSIGSQNVCHDWTHTHTPAQSVQLLEGELAGCTLAPPTWRQTGRLATARTRRQGAAAISAPEMASSTKLWGSQLLTTSSWDPRWLTSARSVAAWDQCPRGDTQHTWDGALEVSPGNQAAGTGEVIKTHGPPGTVHSPSTWSPELLGPGKYIKCKAHLGQCPCRAPRSLSIVDPGSTCCLGLGQTQCGPYTANTPHKCQWNLFRESLPPQNTTEQVSLNKWPHLPPVSGWKLDTEETVNRGSPPHPWGKKKNKEAGTTLEVTGKTD